MSDRSDPTKQYRERRVFLEERKYGVIDWKAARANCSLCRRGVRLMPVQHVHLFEQDHAALDCKNWTDVQHLVKLEDV